MITDDRLPWLKEDSYPRHLEFNFKSYLKYYPTPLNSCRNTRYTHCGIAYIPSHESSRPICHFSSHSQGIAVELFKFTFSADEL